MEQNQRKQFKRKPNVPWKAALAKVRTHMLRKSHAVKVTVRSPGHKPVVKMLYIHDELPLARTGQGWRYD